MSFPLVSKEVIESIREQNLRSNPLTEENVGYYLTKGLKEIEEENPHLYEAIVQTLSEIFEEFKISKEVACNTLNLAVCVYQSIKQQMICDELQ